MQESNILVIGAGINGLIAANYLRRAGCNVTMLERASRVGGACVSEVADVDGVTEHYALGASVLGLMQDFVFEETGLASRLETFVPSHPKFIFFPGDEEPAWIYRDPAELDRELKNKWGEMEKSRPSVKTRPASSNSCSAATPRRSRRRSPTPGLSSATR